MGPQAGVNSEAALRALSRETFMPGVLGMGRTIGVNLRNDLPVKLLNSQDVRRKAIGASLAMAFEFLR